MSKRGGSWSRGAGPRSSVVAVLEAVEGASESGAARLGGAEQPRQLTWRAFLAASVVALVVLAFASLMLDVRGSLGTDTGGKVATLEAMAERPLGSDPDVGYWAAEWDPEGQLHGLVHTAAIGERYVNVTTLPMLELGAPLYRWGGYRLALLLPMFGAIGAGWASYALARRLEATSRQRWIAYWLVVLSSPLTIYGLDFWEHAPGAALMAGALVLFTGIGASRWNPALAAGSGVAFGFAYSMRTEAIVYAVVATGLLVLWLLWSRRFVAAVTAGVCAGAGFVSAAAGNLALEHVVLGEGFRSGRATGTAQSAGSDLVLRLKEAVVTASGLRGGMEPADLVLAVAVGGALIAVIWLAGLGTPGPIVKALAVVLVALVVLRFLQGFGFVPGLLMAWPVAGLGLVAGLRRTLSGPHLYLFAVAVGALPLVWLFQYTGGAAPQWGGRYVLLSGLLLTVIGITRLHELAPPGRRLLLGGAVAVTLFGVLWLSVRSHQVGDATEAISARPEPVLISTEPFFLRELGTIYQGSRWLSIDTRAELEAASDVVTSAGYAEFALLELSPSVAPPDVDGFGVAGSDHHRWLDTDVRITRYAQTPR